MIFNTSIGVSPDSFGGDIKFPHISSKSMGSRATTVTVNDG